MILLEHLGLGTFRRFGHTSRQGCALSQLSHDVELARGVGCDDGVGQSRGSIRANRIIVRSPSYEVGERMSVGGSPNSPSVDRRCNERTASGIPYVLYL